MHLRQTFYASFLILAVFLFVSGCISSMGMKNATANALQVVTTPVPPPLITTTSTVPSPARTSCSASERREYRVIQGDPFTYEGTIPDNANLSVEVSVYSELEPGPSGSSMPVPVNANGTFLVAISGNQTGLDWENYLSTLPYGDGDSPYDHVCLRYSTGTDCFDLLLVQDTKDLTTVTNNTWIQIDSLPDQNISLNEVQSYTGDFFINGTTNIPPGENISLSLESMCMMPCGKMGTIQFGCCGYPYGSDAKVQAGSCGVNTWSIFVNTSPNIIGISTVNGVYGDINGFMVSVTRQNRTLAENGWDTAYFVVHVIEGSQRL
ncbi:MAG: hypothetical protein WAK75_06610 [Methanoregula sp.]|uniref:hypothetical protein n=3 Tax=Methanoregula sp. TaxID=2052170 RepID=UPI003BAF4679